MFIISDILAKFTKRRLPKILAAIAFVVVFTILGLAWLAGDNERILLSAPWCLNPFAFLFFWDHRSTSCECTFAQYMFTTYITAEIWSIIVWVVTLFLSYCTEKFSGDRKES